MVPNGWTETHLGEVITHKKGFAFNSGSYRDKGIRIVRISDTTRNSVHSENPVYLAEEDANGLENYKLTKDDIILSTVGSRPHLLDSMVGKAVKVPLEADGSLLNQNLVKVIPKVSKITNEYLYEMLKNKRFIFFISTLVRGNANQVSITLSDLFQYRFVLPPLPEQKKIAQILSTWDKAITTTEQLLANSQQQKKALMQQLLTGKQRLLDQNGERFEGDWEATAIAVFIKESRVPGSTGDIAKKITVKLYGNGVVAKDEKRSGSESTKYYRRSAGQFIYSKLDFLNGAFGIIPKELDGYESTLDLPAFDFLGTVDVDWFTYYVSREEFYSSNLGLANGGRKARRVNPNDLLKIKIPAPSLEEQQKIAAVLSAADQEITTLQQQLDHLKQEKKALMQQLLTGKRRVALDA
ncbi:restriction endonuclease subunit S [Marinomonas communis]|uniref:Type I restriction enzyme S subunit n=1 Tax=Marinomonas communis TaxID=28254 RepID=A0A4R6WXH5_9GAMM|nr:restriction endonuclease subunit S [Marinomonas communis]TDR05901.1 type I restriction enzyme S subunit [Marinomonas communis]